jgi:hypothetical protein
MDLVVIVPMLGRAHRVAPLLASIHATCKAHVLFAVTPGDVEVIDAIDAAGEERITVERKPRGDFQRKINTGIAVTSEPYIFTGADDLLFHPGWYDAAVARITSRIGVVGTNDLCNPRVMRGDHATHMLVSRDYVERYGTIDEPGKFFHEGYPHEMCDDEAVNTAKRRRAWAFAGDSYVEHLHPMAGKGVPMDSLYAGQKRRMEDGRLLYRRRSQLWR